MSGSVTGISLSPDVENPEADGAGPARWQRARLVLDRYQRGVDAGPVGRVLPVRAGLAPVLPLGGLRRGSTVVVSGSTTVLLTLLAEATTDGAWAAVVGMPDLGLLAAAELGVALSRMALVPKPGAELGGVVAALLDGVDLVVVGPTVRADLARRLSARARHRESVLLTPNPWPGADLRLDCADRTWHGLGQGHGHLTAHELTITAQGRGAANRPLQTTLTLPEALPEPPRPQTHRPATALSHRTTQPRAPHPPAVPHRPAQVREPAVPHPPAMTSGLASAMASDLASDAVRSARWLASQRFVEDAR